MAQTYGQHSNADVIYLTRENYVLCETLTFLQEQFNGLQDDNDREQKVLFQISQILQNLPSLIDHETAIVENIDIKKSILNTVILQEVFFSYLISILNQLNTVARPGGGELWE